MGSNVINSFVKEVYPKAISCIPYMRDAAIVLLTIKVFENVMKGIFPHMTAVQKSYIPLPFSSLALALFKPFSTGAFGCIGLAWMVSEAFMGFMGYNKPQLKATEPLPRIIQSLSRAPLNLSALSNAFPQPISNLFEQIKPGKSTSFKAAEGEGWDLRFFQWVLAQNKNFIGYFLYQFTGNSETDVDELQKYIDKHPNCVIITEKKLPKKLELREKACLIEYFPANSDKGKIPLNILTKEETVGLFNAWIKTPQFSASFPSIRFSPGSIERIYQFAQEDKSISVFSRLYSLLQFKFNVPLHIYGSSQDGPLTIYSLTPSASSKYLRETALKLKKATQMDIAYCPEHQVIIPAFIKQILNRDLSKARTGQSTQIREALGEKKALHARVMGCDRHELESVLPMLNRPVCFLEDVESFLLDKDSNTDLLLDYLWSQPNTVLYIPNLYTFLKKLDKETAKETGAKTGMKVNLFKNLPSKTSIVGYQESVSRYDQQLIEYYNLTDFKEVCLVPLTQEECFNEIKAWGGNYRFEKDALEIAVECAFLLNEENGTEPTFIKDLIERAAVSKKGEPISAKDIWETFITLYRLHVKRRKEEQLSRDLIFQETQEVKVKSLVSIALELKKKYGVVLPIRIVKLSEPPEFLTNLNEKVKGLTVFAVPIGKRLQDLGNALTGQYQNALIIAPSGAGKTTLVEMAAYMSANKMFNLGHPLYRKTIYALNLNAFMGDTKYVGELEKKIEVLFNFLMQSKDAVLFIDEVHLTMGAGTSKGNEMGSFAQSIKCYLEQSGISVIGATTEDEYAKWIKVDGAFVRRFNPMFLDEPSDDDARKIFQTYIATAEFKQLNSIVTIDDENITTVLNMVTPIRSKTSLIDRGKKLLESIAKKSSKASVDKAFIEACHKDLIRFF